ncbi:hypothetical protein LC612_40975 [Nostoc sp. CHAB 5834]|nr:hypothetical protein [Nostoc sp. CHAB 5834]
MNHTKLRTCALNHNSDFSGGMYLSVMKGVREILVIVVLDTLKQALIAYPRAKAVPVKGPDGTVYKADDLVMPPRFTTLKPGEYREKTVKVAREDILEILGKATAESVLRGSS